MADIVTDLRVPSTTKTVLRELGVVSLQDFLALDFAALFSVPGVGPTTVQRVMKEQRRLELEASKTPYAVRLAMETIHNYLAKHTDVRIVLDDNGRIELVRTLQQG